MPVDNQLPAIKPQEEESRITGFIRDTFKQAGKTTAVVAVSGGVDSATSLALTARALGPDHVHALLLPSNESSEQNTADSTLLAEFLKIPGRNVHEIGIGSLQDITKQVLSLYTNTLQDPSLTTARTGNIAARLRMLILYDQAAAHDALVVGTENLSEHYLGYFTRFGDEASDAEPIKHLFKTQVYALAAALQIPQAIIKKAPSAGLWADQTDEAELCFSYEQADPILYFHFEKGKKKQELLKLGFDENLIEKVLDHCDRVAFKHSVPYHLK